MLALYARNTDSDLLVRVGRKVATLDVARRKARALNVYEVEIREDALPRSRNLLTIFIEGREIDANPYQRT